MHKNETRKLQPPIFVFAPRESKNGAYFRVPADFSGEYKYLIKGKKGKIEIEFEKKIGKMIEPIRCNNDLRLDLRLEDMY